jgi:hypothetical protein
MHRPAANRNANRNRSGRFVRLFGWLAAGVLFGSVIQAADSQPANVFGRPSALPPNLRRVAVLPLATESLEADLPDGCAALQPVLFDELVRAEKFEVVSVRPENLRASSGRAAWTGTEPLPRGFFDSLRREYGCDDVLFCELTVYHAYTPLAVGWRLKLADARTQKIIWAADTVFYAGEPGVARNAVKFMRQRDAAATADESRWQSANSPRQFGRYTAAEIIGTLPPR